MQNVNKPHISKPSPSLLSVPEFSSLQLQAPIKGKYKKKRNRSSSSPCKEKPPHTAIMDHLMLGRPHSIHADSVAQFDQGMLRKSQALAISPRMLRSWVARKYMQSNEAFIYFPTHSTPSFNSLSRSVWHNNSAVTFDGMLVYRDLSRSLKLTISVVI